MAAKKAAPQGAETTIAAAKGAAAKIAAAKVDAVKAAEADKAMTQAQRAYEQRRAAKAGKSLDAWLDAKRKAETAAAKASAPPPKPRPPGLLKRLLDRAHAPLKK